MLLVVESYFVDTICLKKWLSNALFQGSCHPHDHCCASDYIPQNKTQHTNCFENDIAHPCKIELPLLKQQKKYCSAKQKGLNAIKSSVIWMRDAAC